MGGLPYGLAELFDATQGEGPADQAPDAGVVRRVHVEQVRVQGGRERESAVIPGQRVLLVEREQRVRESFTYVVVPRDQPGGLAVGAGDAVYGAVSRSRS
ncbi:hypothetical protein SAV31267_027700 [Streptomyces avermitilis]|uniref:Uncharacterized protein n=1 Tax=Streptomyces avermitilis TaxID=33903 RepID=A0A4D4MP01_STRAX|nr:hypothetical protein SAV31267_027700 [Streptomyces avermitilis]